MTAGLRASKSSGPSHDPKYRQSFRCSDTTLPTHLLCYTHCSIGGRRCRMPQQCGRGRRRGKQRALSSNQANNRSAQRCGVFGGRIPSLWHRHTVTAWRKLWSEAPSPPKQRWKRMGACTAGGDSGRRRFRVNWRRCTPSCGSICFGWRDRSLVQWSTRFGGEAPRR